MSGNSYQVICFGEILWNVLRECVVLCRAPMNVAYHLRERFNIKSIIITKGSDGTLLNLDETCYSHPGYTVKVVDTSGCGDAFPAAVISKIIDRAPPMETLDFASRLGAYVASRKEACPDYTLSVPDRIHILQN